MRSLFRRLAFVVSLILISGLAYGFDFSTWIHDPMTWIHRNMTTGGCSVTDKENYALSAYLEQAWWSDSAHIGWHAVDIPNTSTLPYTALSGYDLKIMNVKNYPFLFIRIRLMPRQHSNFIYRFSQQKWT